MVAIVLLCATLLSLVAVHLNTERDAEIAETRGNLRTTAQAIAQHVGGVFDSTDVALSAVADELAHGPAPSGPADRSAQLARRTLELPTIRDMLVLDASGAVIASSQLPSGAAAGSGDVQALQSHAAGSAITRLVGPAARQADGAWTVGVSRAFQVQGHFGGVVIAHVELSKLSRFLASFDIGSLGTVSLLTGQGRMLLRQPFLESVIDADLADRPFFTDYLQQGRTGASEFVSAVDGVRRLNGWQELDHDPLVVFVGMSRDEALAGWRADAIVHMTASGVLMLLACGGVAWSATALRRTRAAERRAASIALDFRMLAESSTELISRVSLAGVRCYVSPASLEILGYTPAELMGTKAYDFVHPCDLNHAQEELRGVKDGTQPMAHSVHRVRHKAGHWVWIELAVRCRRDPDSGEVMDYVSSARDVTARQLAEEALAREEARYRLLAETTSDVIVRLDRDYHRIHVSPRCLPMLGYTQDEMLADPLQNLVHPEDWLRVKGALEAARRGAVEDASIVYRAKRKDGSEVWLEVANTHVVEDDGFVAVIRDVTQRRLAEASLEVANTRLDRLARHLSTARDRAEAANQAKSRFVTSMSHELRTPLHGMMGHAQLLRLEGELNLEQQERVSALLDAGRHLMSMINDVLDLAQVEAERIVLHPAPCDIPALAASCLDLVRPAAEAKGLALQLQFGLRQGQVLVDATRLRQVLVNLLGNAVKFTPAGAITLRLRSGFEERVRIEVEDTGPGIPNMERDRVFARFERQDGEAVEGAGLGLALASKLVALMGGTIAIADPAAGPETGCVFWFDVEMPAAHVPLVDDGAAEPAPRPLRVLVVDDVAVNRDIARAILAGAGHAVRCAESGEAALEAVTTEPFDVVLMDVRMPGMDGLEATRRIRALDGPAGRVPVVAVTAQAFSEQISACRAAGMGSHLPKPFEPGALLRKVAETAAEPWIEPPSPGREAPPSGAFQAMAALLGPDDTAHHLDALHRRASELQAMLLTGEPGEPLALLAHELAGSVGMFGYRTLAEAALDFERACDCGDSGASRVELLSELAAYLRPKAPGVVAFSGQQAG